MKLCCSSSLHLLLCYTAFIKKKKKITFTGLVQSEVIICLLLRRCPKSSELTGINGAGFRGSFCFQLRFRIKLH